MAMSWASQLTPTIPLPSLPLPAIVPATVRAVTMAVHRIAVAVGEVVAVDIVHVAVGIVVNAVAGDLPPGWSQMFLYQIGMRVVDPGVDERR